MLNQFELGGIPNFYQIIDLVNASIYWKDIDGRYLGCNNYVLKLFGLNNLEEILGKTDYELFPQAEAEAIAKVDQKVLKEGRYEGEECGTTTAGEGRTFFTTKAKLFDSQGNVIGISGTSIDITDTKKRLELEKQQAVVAEEVKTKQIIDLVGASIYWKDKAGRFLGCNKYVLNIFGFTDMKEILGKTDYDLLPKHDADKINEIDTLALKNGHYDGEEYGTIKNGEKKVYFTSKHQLLDGHGNVIGIIGTSIDITAQKEAEALRLENAAHKANAEKDAAFKKVAAQVMHDIQSPLATISIIASEASSNMPEHDRVAMRNATTRIRDIANNLLNRYSNKAIPDSAKESSDAVTSSSLENTEKHETLASLALLQVLSEKRYEYSKNQNVTFDIDFEKQANFAAISINVISFKRMISNLINNAVEAVSNKTDGKIRVFLGVIPSDIVIIIKDNGPGMPKHIQEKFNQGIAVTEGKGGGHGIGLTQVRSAILSGNGQCDIEVDETGTEIFISFPKIATPHWVAAEIKLKLDDTIVILDDYEAIHRGWDTKFAGVLAKFPKLQVKHFEHGLAAIDYINSLSEDERQKVFLLTDYELLGQNINGLDVIKQTGIKRSVLVTSYFADQAVVKVVMNVGAKLLPKELIAEIGIVVDRQIVKWSKKVDMVWVEDSQGFVDDLVRRFYSHLEVDVYYDLEDFLEDMEQYPLDTRFILDTYYYAADGTPYIPTGFTVARKLHDLGYTNLILVAGEKFKEEGIPKFLKVILKDDIANLKILDQL